MPRPWQNRYYPLTPSQQFSLILLLVLLVGGGALAGMAAWQVRQTVLGRTWIETLRGIEGHFPGIFGTDIFVQPPASTAAASSSHASPAGGGHEHYATPEPSAALDVERFDRVARFHLQVYDVVHARFYRSADGLIVYSYQPEEIGQSVATLTAMESISRSLHGETVIESASLAVPTTLEGAEGREVMSFYIPVSRDGRVVGAAWVQRDVTDLMAAVRQAQAMLVGLTAAIMGLLFVALRHVYASSTRRIAAQANALDNAYRELSATYDATLRALTTALDSRDQETHGHAQRVTRLAVRLGAALGLTDEDMSALELGAMLHDIGKIGVPDAILRKPGPLTEDEWVIMRQHTTLGAEMLADVPFLQRAMLLVRHHHERWDGKGYPDGLVSAAIPLGARIFAVADAFDAMTTRRPYRESRPPDDALAELRRVAGSQLDPQAVEAFVAAYD